MLIVYMLKSIEKHEMREKWQEKMCKLILNLFLFNSIYI